MMNTLDLARAVWDSIKSNLEDRSVLELGSVDEDLIAEIDHEQIQIIANAISRNSAAPIAGQRED